jgi:hypothetical protein
MAGISMYFGWRRFQMASFASCITHCMVDLTNFMDLSLLERPPVVLLLKTSQNFMEPEGSLPCSKES